MRTIQTSVYQYDELSDAAKAKARDWFRECSAGDTFWSESVIEDAQTIAALMGIEISTRDYKTTSGKTRQRPSVYWSGFCSQGDGACFEGTWNAAKVKAGAVKEYAPKDNELARISGVIETIAAKYPHGFFRVKHSGHYCHERCTEFDVELLPDTDGDLTQEKQASGDTSKSELVEATRDFMRWIYAQLESAYNYEQDDETVAENIRANEYEFTEKGKRF